MISSMLQNKFLACSVASLVLRTLHCGMWKELLLKFLGISVGTETESVVNNLAALVLFR